MKEIVMKIVSVNNNMVKAKSIEKNSIHASFKMFVKLLTDVNGLYILWVSAEMAYNFFNLKHCSAVVFV